MNCDFHVPVLGVKIMQMIQLKQLLFVYTDTHF